MSSSLKILILICGIFCVSESLNAQPITWENRLEYSAFSTLNKVKQTNDGGYIAVGQIKTGIYTKIYFVKFDMFGDTLWSKFFDLNVNDYYIGECIEETHDKGFIIAGSGAGPNSDAYLIKTDSFGNITWYKTFGGNGLDQGKFVKQTYDNGFIMQCRTTSFSSNNDILLIKTDSTGNTEWQKLFAYSYEIGGAGVDLIDSSGYILGSVIFQVGQWARIKIFRLNRSGDILWENEYGKTMTSAAYSIKYSSKKTIVVLGNITYSGLNYILNLDTLGNVIWQKTHSFPGIHERGMSISESPGRGYIYCSEADSLPNRGVRFGVLRLLDYNGNIIFQKLNYYGINNIDFRSVSPSTDGGFIICGKFSTPNNYYYAYLLKTDSSGNLKPTLALNNYEQTIDYYLYQNYPNPFNSQTNISFKLKSKSDVIIEIIDLLGRKISTEYLSKLQNGIHNYNFDASSYNLSTGIYFYKINIKSKTDQFQYIKKMLYLK